MPVVADSNKSVKRRIADALFALMREKDIEDITVTEIIKAAGVARVTFYRNYSSKENVLTTLIDEALVRFARGREHSEIDCNTYNHVLESFRFFRANGDDVLNLYRSKFATILLDKLNAFHESIAGSMPHSSVEKYRVYFFMGAMFDAAIKWLENGCKEPAEEIAEVFCAAFGITEK